MDSAGEILVDSFLKVYKSVPCKDRNKVVAFDKATALTWNDIKKRIDRLCIILKQIREVNVV